MDNRDLDYHPDSGAGSYSDAIQDQTHPDTERSEGDIGATTFDPSDAADSERFNELRKRHHEHWNQDLSDYIRTDIAYDVRMVCNRLELTEYQESRVVMLIDDYIRQGRQYEKTIMGVVTYVLNTEDRWIQRGDSELSDDLHDEYQEICESFNVTSEDVKAITREIGQD